MLRNDRHRFGYTRGPGLGPCVQKHIDIKGDSLSLQHSSQDMLDSDFNNSGLRNTLGAQFKLDQRRLDQQRMYHSMGSDYSSDDDSTNFHRGAR